VRRVSRFAFVSWSVLALGGCAAISGLDQIQENDCAPNCDGGTGPFDGTVDSPVALPEGSANGPDGTADGSDGSSQQEAASSDDSSTGNDASDTGADGDAQSTDAQSTDAHVQDTGVDAPQDHDSGCGPTNTVQNCGACGQACAAIGGGAKSVGCSGTTCLYQCTSGYLDCNASVGYDKDGCECDVTAASSTAVCCGTACPIKHSDGLPTTDAPNPNFYDCVSTGTYTQALAMDACTAFTGDSSLCSAGQCTNAADAGTGDFVVCGQQNAAGACPCWEYQGPSVGKVTIGNGTHLLDCVCPGSSGSGITTYPYQ
jgi:hypothetical protein